MTVEPLSPSRFSDRHIESVAALSALRGEFGRWLADEGVGAAKIDDLLVVLSELGANAVRGTTDASMPATVWAEVRDGSVHIDVTNQVDEGADAVPAGEWDLDDPLRTGGRGLLVVSALVDDVEVEARGDRLHVRCSLTV